MANGVPGLELRLPLLYTYGVGAERISLPEFVNLTATRHAETYGLYPRKGTIAVGSDADIAIWDPQKTVVIEQTHDRTGYTPYKGRKLKGWPVTVLSRGEVIVEDGGLVAKRGRGRFIVREPSEALRPLGRDVPEMEQLDAWGTPPQL
jgi:dihydropyrimidinase